eukprot:10454351-Alexandrium_andersonii.AAC.1
MSASLVGSEMCIRDSLTPHEEHAVNTLVDSGLLDETHPPPNISLRVELLHAEGPVHAIFVRG